MDQMVDRGDCRHADFNGDIFTTLTSKRWKTASIMHTLNACVLVVPDHGKFGL
jgi:hypothetical protein